MLPTPLAAHASPPLSGAHRVFAPDGMNAVALHALVDSSPVPP